MKKRILVIRKRVMTDPSKSVCLECQTYVGNCKADCSGTNRFSVSNSFRPPKIGSPKWKLVEKLIRKNVYEGKDDPTDIQGSASFSRHSFRRKKHHLPKMLRERGYPRERLEREGL